MDKKIDQINYCTVIRYSIIEITPSFLKHKIPLIYLINVSLYWTISIYIFIRNTIYSLFSGINNFFKYISNFFKNKTTIKGKGLDINLNFDKLNEQTLKSPYLLEIDDISLLPSHLIYKKEAIFFYKSNAIKKLESIKDQYHLKIKKFKENEIVLKKEIFYISKEASALCNKIIISISYNEAALIMLKLLEKIKLL